MRSPFVFLIATGTLLVADVALAQGPATTRIETRPFYGATVTLEEGVRVFRPLPPHDRVIINPNGRTPLNLTYEEQQATSHNYHYGATDAPGSSSSAYAGGGFGRAKPAHRHDRSGVKLPGGSGPGTGGHR